MYCCGEASHRCVGGVRACVCLCDSGLALACIHVPGRRWRVEPTARRQTELLPSSNPSEQRPSRDLNRTACPAQTNHKRRRSPFSATPAEGGLKVTGKEKRKQVLSVCRATRLGDGLEHNSEEPHEVLTNG